MATAGKTSVGGTQDLNGANDGAVQGPYTVGVGATITEFQAYLQAFAAAVNQNFRPLVYQDNAGEPGNLISTLPEIVVTPAMSSGAWRVVSGLSVNVTSAAIWIGLWNSGTDYRYVFDTPGGTPGRYKSVLAAYSSVGSAPTPWPVASDSTSTQEVSLYVVYTPPAAGDTETRRYQIRRSRMTSW